MAAQMSSGVPLPVPPATGAPKVLQDRGCEPDFALVHLESTKHVPLATAPFEVELLVDAAMTPKPVLSDIRDQAVAFGDLLVQLASRVFDLPKSAVKVFLHTTTGTSAFNYGGLLYFNLHRYSGSGRESVYYWYTVMAHEIAHNAPASAAHNQAFASAMGDLIAQYMPRLMLLLADYPVVP